MMVFLPNVLLEMISDYARENELLDWIDQEKINWYELSKNPAAIHLLEKNPEKINWTWLSMNPAAIHLLEKNPEKIDWDELSRNPSAIHLLEKNPEKITWAWLSSNQSIFKSKKNDIYNSLYEIQNWIYKLDLL